MRLFNKALRTIENDYNQVHSYSYIEQYFCIEE